MLAFEEADEATGAAGLADMALPTKAQRPPRTNAATPAMMIVRKVPRFRVCWLELTTVDIFLYFSGTYEVGRLSVTDPMNISNANDSLLSLFAHLILL
jgi:hypothetical protein